MRISFIITFFFATTFALSQELPPDPNKVSPPSGYSDPDPSHKPVTVPGAQTVPVIPNAFQVYNGYHTLYNKKKQKTKEGFFQNNKLCDGNAYFYDDNGKLLRISKYRNCLFVKDSLISK